MCDVCLDATGAMLYSHPYQLCSMPQFMAGGEGDFLRQLTEEVVRLKFMEKNNDLYQFRQVHSVYRLLPTVVLFCTRPRDVYTMHGWVHIDLPSLLSDVTQARKRFSFLWGRRGNMTPLIHLYAA